MIQPFIELQYIGRAASDRPIHATYGITQPQNLKAL